MDEKAIQTMQQKQQKVRKNNMIKTNLTEKELEQIMHTASVRKTLACKSHQWFFSIYLSHYMKYAFAPFHNEIFLLTHAESVSLSGIVAFRGSGKSTLISLSYAIWAIVGMQQKKFVLLLTQTQSQARQLLYNIKQELENNQLLKGDIGPFEEVGEQWAATSIVLSRYNARITVASSEQSVRGIRHGSNRPDVIICDDIEDLNSVKTLESRDKIYQWFTGEVLPAGDKYTKTIIVGNLLHEDSIMMRLKHDIEEKHIDGVFKEYPLLTNENISLWPGKFPDQAAIQKERQKIGSEVAWQREYMLRIISDDSRIVRPEWIKYYDQVPEQTYTTSDYRFSALGIDLAISEKTSADCTAIIAARVFGYKDTLRIYILPRPVNEHLSFPETVAKVKALALILEGKQTKIFIEEVGYQKALVDQLKHEEYRYAEGVSVHGQDKKARLTLTTDFIQTGKVLFPAYGAEALITQLTGFGVERYDDLADAFSIFILKIIDLNAVSHHLSFAAIEMPKPFQDLQPISNFFKHTIDWNDPKARDQANREADLQIMQEELQRARNGWI